MTSLPQDDIRDGADRSDAESSSVLKGFVDLPRPRGAVSTPLPSGALLLPTKWAWIPLSDVVGVFCAGLLHLSALIALICSPLPAGPWSVNHGPRPAALPSLLRAELAPAVIRDPFGRVAAGLARLGELRPRPRVLGLIAAWAESFGASPPMVPGCRWDRPGQPGSWTDKSQSARPLLAARTPTRG